MFSPKTIANLDIPAVNYGRKEPQRTDMVDQIKKMDLLKKKCLDHCHSEATRSSSGIIGPIQSLKE